MVLIVKGEREMQTIKRWSPIVIVVSVFLAAIVAGPRLVQEVAFAVTKGQIDASRTELAELAKNDTMSTLFVQVSKVLKPAVVEIRVTKKMKANAAPDMEDFLRRFFGDESPGDGRRRTMPQPSPHEREYLARGIGSGVIVDAKNGYVLTNAHVVANTDETQIVLDDGRTLKSQWVRLDTQTDLAIVKVQAENLIDAPLGDSDKMSVGDWVLAIGSPEGLQQTVTAGIISAKGRTTGDPNSYQSFLQTDAAINHGNSGGPLVNMRGEVIGITSAIVSRTGVNEGIGFAVPSNMAKTVMSQLIDKGKVTRGFLGVTIQNVDENLAKSFKLPVTAGALVTSVSPGSPAEKAKLKEGDFIVSIDGKNTDTVNDLRNIVAALQPGKSYKVEFYRDGKKTSADIKIDSQPEDMGVAAGPSTEESKTSEQYGLEVQTMTPELAQEYQYKKATKGVVITEVTTGSPAEEQGLAEGMTITAVNGKEVATADEFAKAISAKTDKEGVQLRVTGPSGATRFVFLPAQKVGGKESEKK